MNTNSPAFRLALSIAALWLAIWGYLAVQRYRTGYQEPSRVAFAADETIDANCSDRTLDFIGENPIWREATTQEKSECRKIEFESRLELVRLNNAALPEQSARLFANYGILPAVAVLMLVAWWSALMTMCSALYGRYSNWLRYGTKGPDIPEK